MASVSSSEAPVALRQLSRSHCACCCAGSWVILAESSCCSCHAAFDFFFFLACAMQAAVLQQMPSLCCCSKLPSLLGNSYEHQESWQLGFCRLAVFWREMGSEASLIKRNAGTLLQLPAKEGGPRCASMLVCLPLPH